MSPRPAGAAEAGRARHQSRDAGTGTPVLSAGAARRRLRWFDLLVPAGVFLWVLMVAAAISAAAFGRTPHVPDSIAQLFQAQIFAAGRVWTPPPSWVEFVGSEFVVAQHGRWYSQYPPGHSALLAVGILLGAPWLVNPLLGAAAAPFLYAAGRAACSRRVALMATLLYALSPFVWFMSAEYMNHSSTMFFGSMALWCAAVEGKRQKAKGKKGTGVGLRGPDRTPFCLFPLSFCLPAVAGAAVGLAATVRPLSAAAFGLPLAVYFAVPPGSLPARLRRMALFGAAVGVAFSPALLFNLATSGGALLFGYEVQWGQSGLGFGVSQWGPPHTPLRGLENSLRNLDALGKYLLEWPFPCLLPLLGLWWVRRCLTTFDALLASWLAGLVAAHVCYFYQDLCFGPRFLYEAVPPLLLLLAHGLLGLAEAGRRFWVVSPQTARRRVWRGALLCSAFGLVLNLPALWKWYSVDFWSVDHRFVQRLRRDIREPAIVFIRDANRAREVRLLRTGVSRRTAHSAITSLDEGWIDRQQLAALARHPGDSGAAAAELDRRLAEAVGASPPRPARRHPFWLDYDQPSTSWNQALVGNGPDPARQRVVFALDLGPRNRELLAALPGRTAYRYAWADGARAFRLVRLGEWAGALEKSQVLLRKSGKTSRRYSPKGIHQTRSFVTQRTSVAGGQAPVAISHASPAGPASFPSMPTAAISQPRSGQRATSR